MKKILRGHVLLTAGIAIAATALASAGTIAPAYGGERSSAPAAPHLLRARPAAASAAEDGRASMTAANRLRTIVLITGDRLAVSADPANPRSGPALAPLPGSLSDGLASFRVGGDDLAVPYDALPYLGRGLDPSLFSVPALLSREEDGRIPVSVRFSGPGTALPGITVTSMSAGTAAGYLTATSARVFGAALARQFAIDHARGSYGSDGMFGAGTFIGLAGSAPAGAPRAHRSRPVTSRFRLGRLTVLGTNLAGKPDTGDEVFVFDVDNLLQFGDPLEPGQVFVHGSARYSVPPGRYFGLALFFRMSHGRLTALRATVRPQFTVSGRATVRFAASAADSKITMVTPRPSVMTDNGFELDRAPVLGNPLIIQLVSGTLPQWISPTATRPTAGSLNTITSALLFSPARARSRYLYNLSYRNRSGLIQSQRFLIRPAGLATIAGSYFSATKATGLIQQNSEYTRPAGSFGSTPLLMNITGPGSLPLEYLTAGPTLQWFTLLNRFLPNFLGDEAFETRSFRPGQHVSEDWNRYPLHPVPYVSVPGAALTAPLVASATRTGNQLDVLLTPFSDDTPGHLSGEDLGFTGSYKVDQNGTRIASGNAASTNFLFAFGQAVLSPRPATTRFTLDVQRSVPEPERTRTVWTWKSAREPGASLPGGWICGSAINADITTHCAAQPLLALSYRVAGLRLDGSAAPGTQALSVSVGHMQPSASTAKITTAHVQVSFDHGRTWSGAAVTPTAPGRFAASYTAPRNVSSVALRVSAADAAGSTVTETIWNAYGIAAAAAPARPASPGEKAACPAPRPGFARCFALYQPQVAVNRAIAAGRSGVVVIPSGWGARQLEAAYKLPVSRRSHQTVAVSIAFDTPRLEQFLAVYRKHFGLPPCTTANGCFRKVNQRGQARPLPPSGVLTGWDLEATLDVSMISAACPHCHILVVEGNNNNDANLAITEKTAARLGAQVISNSYGSRESGIDAPLARDYYKPGHVIVASSGDFGYTAAQFPANQRAVTAVGGTELSRARNARGWSEAAWITPGQGATGSGCSAYVAKPSWQHDTACPGRTIADVSAVADHVAIFNADYGGWVTVAGTSVSAPFIAGVYGLAGNAAHLVPGSVYRHSRSLFDVTTGNNDLFNGSGGASCDLTYLCVAGKGYDGPTGLGTPDGIGAF